MELKARVDDCLMRQCDPMKQQAEAIAERLGLDMDRKKMPTSKDWIPDARAMVANKTWTMGEVIDYHQYEECFTGCQKPARMFQMMIKQNMTAIGRNQKACLEGCRDKQGAMKEECSTTCVKQSAEVIS